MDENPDQLAVYAHHCTGVITGKVMCSLDMPNLSVKTQDSYEVMSNFQVKMVAALPYTFKSQPSHTAYGPPPLPPRG